MLFVCIATLLRLEPDRDDKGMGSGVVVQWRGILDRFVHFPLTASIIHQPSSRRNFLFADHPLEAWRRQLQKSSRAGEDEMGHRPFYSHSVASRCRLYLLRFVEDIESVPFRIYLGSVKTDVAISFVVG